MEEKYKEIVNDFIEKIRNIQQWEVAYSIFPEGIISFKNKEGNITMFDSATWSNFGGYNQWIKESLDRDEKIWIVKNIDSVLAVGDEIQTWLLDYLSTRKITSFEIADNNLWCNSGKTSFKMPSEDFKKVSRTPVIQIEGKDLFYGDLFYFVTKATGKIHTGAVALYTPPEEETDVYKRFLTYESAQQWKETATLCTKDQLYGIAKKFYLYGKAESQVRMTTDFNEEFKRAIDQLEK